MNNRLACVFPGQGSQSLGMLSDLESQYAIVSQTFQAASDALNYDLWQLVQQGPESRLNQTEYTQVAILVASVAVYRCYLDKGGSEPQLMAGHSLGEYSALVCAGAMTLSDAVRLVSARGRLMQETVPLGEGAMAAIVGLDDQAVRDICQQAAESDVVSAANYNAIGQVVIAGHTAAVQRAIQLADAKGARLARLIPVSVPCHCDLLRQTSDSFAQYLADTPMQTPALPVINNVDVVAYKHPEDIREGLQRQLYSPVRWVETVQLIANEGIDTLVECGPGKVLQGLVKRIDRKIKTLSVNDCTSLASALSSVDEIIS